MDQGYEIGWDSQIEHESEFQLLPEGDYNFKVVKFDRGRHNGSENLPPCNKAILTIELSNGPYKSTITHNLFLHSKTEGILCEFFTSIGHRKHGEAFVPKWTQLVGATGTCKVVIDQWQGRDGMRESNKIKRFYEKGHAINPIAPPPASAPMTGFTPGQF